MPGNEYLTQKVMSSWRGSIQAIAELGDGVLGVVDYYREIQVVVDTQRWKPGKDISNACKGLPHTKGLGIIGPDSFSPRPTDFLEAQQSAALTLKRVDPDSRFYEAPIPVNN